VELTKKFRQMNSSHKNILGNEYVIF